jgi:UTP--glucose-1-phosphate uridylyltransferase
MIQEPEYLIIPAAGLGTRMQSVDPNLPKELLPVGPQPAIQYAVDEAISVGIEEIIIIISAQKTIIRRYFEDEAFRNARFPAMSERMAKIEGMTSVSFLYQEAPRGEADAIGLASDIVGPHSMAVFYPDNVYLPAPGALKAVIPIFRQTGKDVIALTEVGDAEGLGNSGWVDLEPAEEPVYRITRFYPKGPGSFAPRFPEELRTCGIAVYGAHLFDYIRRARESSEDREITDGPVRLLMIQDMEILGCRLPGRLFDIGNPQGYRDCLRYIQSTD